MIFTSNIAQAIGAVVLAIVLVGFHRHYQRPYLLKWAWSWWAFCASLLAQSVAVVLVAYMPAGAPARLAASGVAMVAGFWQAAWLLFGTYEVVRERVLPSRFQRTLLGLLSLFALALTLGSVGMEPDQRFFVRVGLRALLVGIAFLVTSWGVWRSRTGRSSAISGIGWRLVSGSFLLYGLHLLQYAFVIRFLDMGDPRLTGYASLTGYFDLLFQGLIGIGLVTWLLEDERQRVVAASEQIEHLAYHDALTDLPNRNLLVQQLKEAVARAETRRERVAVLFLDLDRFKKVNESLGNRPGDDLLKILAERLRHNLRGTDLIARLAADEFVILLPGIDSEASILRVAEKLLAVIRTPFQLQGREIYLTGSLGISRCPEDGADPELLLKRAELAMYKAKETQRDSYQLYAPPMETRGLEHLSLEADLRKALTGEPGELALFFQPVLDTSRRGVAGVEALLRWFHPTRGLLPPSEFLWLAELSGLATALDLWVLRTACREIRGWREQGATDLYLAVNLSPRSFQQPDLLGHIEAVLAETGLPPSALELEITETLAMQNAEATLAVLRGLKDLGVRIAIDDFGTGDSSLSYLTNFPIDTLKVDRSFVHNLGRGKGGEEVAAAVIALALSLEIAVVAEGVESDEQWRWLLGLGCEKFQGYLFSPPLPGAECEDVLLHHRLDPKIRSAEQILTPKQALGS
ncbi:MAG TPA: EAL domain-containing protein [Thermoanaerobaculia bacterium]|nr:EAL domain-containing protein [Thermoanaerobaculia bacterium]